MFFIRVGNGENLMVLRGPHDVVGDLRSNTWALQQWNSAVRGLTIGGVAAESLARRERTESGIIPAPGCIGFIVRWDDSQKRMNEVLLLSTVEATGFYYKELVVSMEFGRIRIAGFKQEIEIGMVHNPTDRRKVAGLDIPNTLDQRTPSLEHLREELWQRSVRPFIDKRGSGKLW